MHRQLLAALALGCAATASAQHAHDGHDPRVLATDPSAATAPVAPVLSGLGPVHHPVTTGSERAQDFFDQGLRLTYAFNHQEALRAFKEAIRLDPDCAMGYWGWALVLGPNLNLPMSPDVAPQAYEAIQQAMERRDRVSDRERAYIEALARRYAPEAIEDRAELDLAYARAMELVHSRYPEDDDAATLYAASLMNLSPWDYWTRDGQPRAYTPALLKALEEVMSRNPQHTGALHYYIHAVESVDPRRGEAAADLLTDLAPGAGHLVHMPSHIYMQTGRYADAFEANQNATLADEGYVTACRNQGIYPLNYYPHNIHFLAWAAIYQGRSAEALKASRKVAGRVPEDMHGDDWALYQTFLSMPLYTMVRFGMWEAILAEPRPREDARYWTGIWHYARGMARVHGGSLDEAQAELDALSAIVASPEALETLVGFANAKTLLRIAEGVLRGELLGKRGDCDRAVAALDQAVRLEDGLLYNEPPDWYYPVRHTLGSVLLEAGRADEAETIFWQDLKRNEENGFALRGLVESLRAQGRDAEAEDAEARFERAWQDADVELRSARF